MHIIHTTPGFIIKSRPRGESGKLLSIFTRDLGLVLATAQGIRLEKSKLRYHSQEYSFREFSFVRGKEFWRLTNAQSYVSAPVGDDLVIRIALLLRRLLHGEEANPELFDHISKSFSFLMNLSEILDEQRNMLESVIVLRVLYFLGYVGKDKNLDARL